MYANIAANACLQNRTYLHPSKFCYSIVHHYQSFRSTPAAYCPLVRARRSDYSVSKHILNMESSRNGEYQPIADLAPLSSHPPSIHVPSSRHPSNISEEESPKLGIFTAEKAQCISEDRTSEVSPSATQEIEGHQRVSPAGTLETAGDRRRKKLPKFMIW